MSEHIEERQTAIAALHADIFGAPAANGNGHPRPVEPVDLDDQALLERAQVAANGAKFRALWAGDTSGHASHSEADLALCALLAFWTGRDPVRMDRLFRSSGLMRAKWNERHGAASYGAMTIGRAVEQCAETYQRRERTNSASRAGAETSAPDGPVLVRLDTVSPARVRWHWPQRVARGKVAMLIGEPGVGKSTIGDDVAARTTRGMAWPDGEHADVGDVVMLVSEDGLADTVRPHIDRQGGDPARVHVLRAVRVSEQECPFNLERDLPALEVALIETRAVLLIISPLSAYLGSRDSYKDAEVRAILDPLAALAERLNVAVLGIMHLTKNQQRRLLNRAQGSVAFVALARVVLAVGEDRDHPGRRLLASVKNNLGPEAPALAFRIGDTGLTWEDTPIVGTADRLLAGDEAPTRTETRELDDAAAFLRDVLQDGPVASKQIDADARANGIAQRTLWRAKKDLGIFADRARNQDGRTAGWYWRLPVEPP